MTTQQEFFNVLHMYKLGRNSKDCMFYVKTTFNGTKGHVRNYAVEKVSMKVVRALSYYWAASTSSRNLGPSHSGTKANPEFWAWDHVADVSQETGWYRDVSAAQQGSVMALRESSQCQLLISRNHGDDNL